MKILVVYYSMTGNVKLMAETISKTLNADLLEVREKNAKAKGVMRFIQLFQQLLLKKMPELESFQVNPGEYDLIFIGTPVWMWTYTPVIRAFFSRSKLQDKKVALFCCHGGGPKKILEHMKAALEGNTVLGEIAIQDPLKKDTDSKVTEITEWAKQMMEKTQ